MRQSVSLKAKQGTLVGNRWLLTSMDKLKGGGALKKWEREGQGVGVWKAIRGG